MTQKRKGESKAKAPRFPKTKWHELWVIRSAALAALLLTSGYFASLMVAIDGVKSITQMAFDPDVEDLMDDYLGLLKKNHRFRQETIVARLERLMPLVYRRGEAPIQEVMVKQWLKNAEIEAFVPLESIELAPIEEFTEKELPKEKIAWLDTSNLRFHQFLIKFPKKLIRKEFEEAESLVLRRRGVRAHWQDEIQPTLISSLIVIFFGTGFLVLLAMILTFRRFKRQVDLLVTGFGVWSEKDASFRFNQPWKGELKFLSTRFNHMADEVEVNRSRRLYLEKVASWQIIARKLAHEIKNPLTPIQMMMSQLVRRYEGDDPGFKSLLEDAKNIITEEVTGLRQMVDSFSKFAQMPEPKLVRKDLSETIRLAVELEKAGFPQHDIHYECDLKEPMAHIDPQLLRQVVINLIKNAAEAANKTPAHIRISLKEQQNHYHILIEDDGPGIPIDLQNRIFEAYFTTKHTGPNPGMGLGLAVCQKVILDHGGDLWVKSKPSQTTFTIKLPKPLS